MRPYIGPVVSSIKKNLVDYLLASLQQPIIRCRLQISLHILNNIHAPPATLQRIQSTIPRRREQDVIVSFQQRELVNQDSASLGKWSR